MSAIFTLFLVIATLCGAAYAPDSSPIVFSSVLTRNTSYLTFGWFDQFDPMLLTWNISSAMRTSYNTLYAAWLSWADSSSVLYSVRSLYSGTQPPPVLLFASQIANGVVFPEKLVCNLTGLIITSPPAPNPLSGTMLDSHTALLLLRGEALWFFQVDIASCDVTLVWNFTTNYQTVSGFGATDRSQVFISDGETIQIYNASANFRLLASQSIEFFSIDMYMLAAYDDRSSTLLIATNQDLLFRVNMATGQVNSAAISLLDPSNPWLTSWLYQWSNSGFTPTIFDAPTGHLMIATTTTQGLSVITVDVESAKIDGQAFGLRLSNP